MPAVATQQLATVADLDLGPADSAMVRALAKFDATTKNTYLRRASGVVLAAYAKRLHRAGGGSFSLATWGDFTIGLVCSIARWEMINDRGWNPDSPTDKTIRARYDDTTKILDEIVDIDNKTPRIDPDAVGVIDADEEGPLAFSEGGPLDEADFWTQKPTPFLPGRDVRSPGNGLGGGGFS